MLRNLILVFSALWLSVSSSSPNGEKDFSSWRKFTSGKLISETASVAPGSVAQIGLKIDLAEKWHTYWVNPGDSGTPLRLEFHTVPGVHVRSVRMPVPERFTSGPLISFAYANEVLFPIEVEISPNVTTDQNIQLSVDAEWLVCDEVCLPAMDTFALELPVTPREEIRPTENLGLFARAAAHLPELNPKLPKFSQDGDSVRLSLSDWTEGSELVDFFPFKGSGVTNEKPRFFENRGKPYLQFQKSNVPRASEDRIGVLVVRSKKGQELRAIQYGQPSWTFSQGAAPNETPSTGSIWWMLFSAFLGGLILNLMPCVFPILSIKLLSLMKVSDSSAAIIRQQNMGYVAGVMISFLGVALVLSGLRTAGHLVGWGFQLQSPVFLTFLCWLFFLLALNLLDLFHIDFIDAGLGGKWTRLGGFWGSFFTGVLAVVVASPCTAPFMGVALGFGLSQPTPILISVFLALGFGLASPYALMIVVPSALWFLPKPGPWMVTVKKVLAIPLLITVLWLCWVLSQITGVIAMAVVITGCALLLASIYIPFQKALIHATTLVLLIGLLAYINTGAKAPVGEAQATHESWYPFSDKLMSDMKGRNVFVNMTADWCLTCKVNERLIFSDPEVLDLLRSKNVNLVMGDWTQRNAEITKFLNTYQRVGVPFYIFFSQRHPEGFILPEVMTKSKFIELVRTEFP